ncbi:hypothetical protein [Staphylococcus agnetis]|nr:hypothetical protein [Staphylococcus agnetis]
MNYASVKSMGKKLKNELSNSIKEQAKDIKIIEAKGVVIDLKIG